VTTVRSLSELEATPHANVFPEEEPKTIRLALEADEEIAEHAHPGREIILHVLSGRLDLRLGDESHEVAAGDIARFDGEQEISPRAIEESTALIVLAARARDD
jgi:quercetin dioxygenase-like cupin family protein